MKRLLFPISNVMTFLHITFFVIACKSSEMAELPARLIDWFHVLKVNEKVQEMKDQRIEQEPVMKEESFTDEKLKSMCKSSIHCTIIIYCLELKKLSELNWS